MEKLNRRDFLRLSALAAAGVTVAACAKTAEPPQEVVPTATQAAAKEKEAEATPVPAGPSTKQAPALIDQVKAGTLPPLEERLTAEPEVIPVIEQIGRYGEDQTMGTLGVADGAIFARYTQYENLARWDVDWTDVIPNIATGWEVKDEGKTFVFSLRKGMKWSDGMPFTADDYMFWYEENTNTELTPVFSTTWSTAGGPVVLTKDDDYTITWTFPDPYGLFLQRQATPSGSQLAHPKHFRQQFFPAYADKADLEAKTKAAGVTYWYEAYGNWTNPTLNPSHPMYWAWQYTNVLGDSPQFIADRNPYYFRTDPEGNQLPYCDRQVYQVAADTQAIVMMAVAGEISYQGRHIAALSNKPLFMDNMESADIRFIDNIGSGMNACLYGINLNHKDPVLAELFQNKDFRIALSHAINRQEIIDVVGLGIGTPWQGAPLPESPLYHETLATQYTEFDPDKANAMLDEILPEKDSDGMRLRPDGKPLALAVEITAGQQSRIDSTELVKGYWANVGIRIEAKVEDRSLFYERKDAWEHDVALWGGDGGMDVVLEPRWYFPFSHESLYATGWARWYTSAGKEGVEPPEAAKKQMELYDELKATVGTEAQNALMTEILNMAQEQFWVMGTYRGGPGYEVCKNKFRNVKQPNLGSWLYPNPGPQNPAQYYWED
jgi:ABC-type transport system substrate-binding protein